MPWGPGMEVQHSNDVTTIDSILLDPIGHLGRTLEVEDRWCWSPEQTLNEIKHN